MPPDYGKLPQPGAEGSIQNIEKKDTSNEY